MHKATRIEHATVVTCREGKPVVLKDMSITFEGARIRDVSPSSGVSSTVPPLSQLRGRTLGRILTKAGIITRAQVGEAFQRQKATPGAIGQVLVEMGYVTEAQLEWALAAQAGREAPIPPGLAAAVDIVDGRGRLVIPGLINTHHHLFQSLTRCLPAVQNARLFDWLAGLYPVWGKLDYESLRQAATVSLAELLLSGCTTTSDHLYVFPANRDARIEAVLEAADSLGMRIHAGRGGMSMGSSAGGLPPDGCCEGEDQIIADSKRVIEAFHDPSPLAMHRIDLAPCAPFNVTPALLDQTRQLAAEHDVLLHTHIAETREEERFCLDKFGVRPIEYLHQHRWLGLNVYLAHCVYLHDGEIRLLAEKGTGVTHCPSSNMRLGSGIAPVRRMLDAGVKVGLGVDGSSSNDAGNLLAEARQALLLQRVAHGADALTAADAFRMATLGGAYVLNRPELGCIERGCAADLVIYNANDVALAGAVAQDPLAALIFCHAPRPERVIINGQTVVEAGQPTHMDLAKLVADFNQLVRERFRP